jgi:hypothetical protein
MSLSQDYDFSDFKRKKMFQFYQTAVQFLLYIKINHIISFFARENRLSKRL